MTVQSFMRAICFSAFILSVIAIAFSIDSNRQWAAIKKIQDGELEYKDAQVKSITRIRSGTIGIGFEVDGKPDRVRISIDDAKTLLHFVQARIDSHEEWSRSLPGDGN